MKKIIAIIALLVLISLVGCKQAAEESIEKGIEAETGYEPEVDIGEKQIDIQAEAGEIEAEVVTGEEAKVKVEGELPIEEAVEWCKENEEWTITKGASKMTVVGIVDSGKYQGYCHVRYEAPEDSRLSAFDFYFDKEGNGYQVLTVNGQQIENEWPN